MENDAEAAQAMNELNGSEFMGRQLVIKEVVEAIRRSGL